MTTECLLTQTELELLQPIGAILLPQLLSFSSGSGTGHSFNQDQCSEKGSDNFCACCTDFLRDKIMSLKLTH